VLSSHEPGSGVTDECGDVEGALSVKVLPRESAKVMSQKPS
jgi:hypothetical protein